MRQREPVDPFRAYRSGRQVTYFQGLILAAGGLGLSGWAVVEAMGSNDALARGIGLYMAGLVFAATALPGLLYEVFATLMRPPRLWPGITVLTLAALQLMGTALLFVLFVTSRSPAVVNGILAALVGLHLWLVLILIRAVTAAAGAQVERPAFEVLPLGEGRDVSAAPVTADGSRE